MSLSRTGAAAIKFLDSRASLARLKWCVVSILPVGSSRWRAVAIGPTARSLCACVSKAHAQRPREPTCRCCDASPATASIMLENSSPMYRICRGSKVARKPVIFVHNVSKSTPLLLPFRIAVMFARRMKAYGTVLREGLMTWRFCKPFAPVRRFFSLHLRHVPHQRLLRVIWCRRSWPQHQPAH